MLGTEPSARMQCEPSTVRPSVSVTVTVSPCRSTEAIRDFDSTFMPRRVSTSSRTAAASASSPGSTRSREETRVTSMPRDEVRRGELRAGHARADDDQVAGHLVEVVDLLPGEDPLAVGLRGRAACAARHRWRPGRASARRICSLPSVVTTTRSVPASSPRPETTSTPSFSSRLAMSADWSAASCLTRRLTQTEVDGHRRGRVALVVGQPHAELGRARPRRSSGRTWRSGSCWGRSRSAPPSRRGRRGRRP